ncbi:MAG: aldo/keto reductase [Coriobacteriia bacterium]|nr:aldo/keto reductase [Coriobacteriia bacterium]MCL2536698.1 aldo/keto reductase [Coriobacteriia bacterium]
MDTKCGNDKSITRLGFGCMRFPRSDEAAEELVVAAAAAGITYFDTAIIYPGSEAKLGRAVNKHGLREQLQIATKIPPYLCKKPGDFDKHFEGSLTRLQTDYIDDYLVHMISDVKVWERMKRLGIIEWAQAQKEAGRIRNFGFSFHGGFEEFKKVVDAYDWDFCLIQYNYLDKNAAGQASDDGLHYAASKGLRVNIMGPLKGGRLADSLPKAALQAFARPSSNGEVYTPEAWALRWLFNQPEVSVVLSGMKTMDVLRANIETAKESYPGMLAESDHEIIADARRAITDVMKVACTGCNYCMPCPQGVDIPTCLIAYNNIGVEGRIGALKNYINHTSLKEQPTVASRCNQCGRCESKCPQHIAIRTELGRVKRSFEGFYYRPIVWIARRILKV